MPTLVRHTIVSILYTRANYSILFLFLLPLLIMELFVDFLELTVGDMCINLGSSYVCMPEEHLDREEIGAI